jgi:heme exporter protein A
MGAMITFSVKNLAKRFGPRGVFRALSFDAKSGEIIAITGPNGSGKSTLSKILMGLLPASTGEIIASNDQDSLTLAERMELTAAVTPYFNLYEALSGYENLKFFTGLRGLSIERTEFDRWLDRFGLAGRGEDTVGGYSSGMRQRLKFAIAFAQQPEILFLDEPASNLDESGKAIVFEEARLMRKKALVFWATNEPDELRFADRVVRLV